MLFRSGKTILLSHAFGSTPESCHPRHETNHVYCATEASQQPEVDSDSQGVRSAIFLNTPVFWQGGVLSESNFRFRVCGEPLRFFWIQSLDDVTIIPCEPTCPLALEGHVCVGARAQLYVILCQLTNHQPQCFPHKVAGCDVAQNVVGRL
jgi:hypothetical protein